MLATEITNHVQQAIARLMQQYVNSPNIQSLLTALVTQIQNLENAIYSLDEGRQLYNGTSYPAVGAQLDGIGEIVGIQRNGTPDAEYLVLILGTIAENYSDGTAAALLNIVQTIFQATSVFLKDPNSNGDTDSAWIAFCAVGNSVPLSLFTTIQQIVLKSVGGGIKLTYLAQSASSKSFAFAGPQSWIGGFGDWSSGYNGGHTVDPTIGAGFVQLVYSNPSI